MRERQSSAMPRPPDAAFFGMAGRFSYAALHSFLDAGGQVSGVFVPADGATRGTQGPAWRALPPPAHRAGPHGALPMLSAAVEPSALSLAQERGIPAFELATLRDPSVLDLLDTLRAAVACVACWPARIPGAALARFPLGVLNLHPSLLPLHRGPAPLFWTLRHGDATAGVTVHLMEAALDAGPILAQRAVALEDGLTGLELEDRCATLGGDLLTDAVRELGAGQADPRAQDPAMGSYEPWPQPHDFIVPTDRSARWAYNFIRAAAYWGGPLVLDAHGTRFIVREAVSYAPEERLDVPWRREAEVLAVRCAPGVLRVVEESVLAR